MEAPSSTNQYPIKLENDQIMDSLPAYHPVLGGVVAQSHLYGGWNPQSQIQHSPISEYPYASYGQSTNYATSSHQQQQQQYADVTMYHHQPSPTTTTDSSLRTSAGNPVSVPVALSAPLHCLGYPNFTNTSSAQQAPFSTTTSTTAPSQQQQQQQHNGSGGGSGIPRPPSVVHSPMNEAFSSRGRSTSYPGPYYLPPPSMHPNTFSSIPQPPSGFPQHPMTRMSQLAGTTAITAETSNNQMHMTPTPTMATTTKQGNNYYNMSGNANANGNGNGMTSPTSLDTSSTAASTPYDYLQEDQSPSSMGGMAAGNPHGQYRPGSAQTQQGMFSFITPPPQQHQNQSQHQHQHQHQHQQQHQQHQALPLPLASSIATGGTPTIPRSMSMGNIPGNGGNGNNTSWFSGRTTPSGILTPGSTLNLSLSLTPSSASASALSRSTASRLGIAPPTLTIPSNFLDHRAASEYDLYSASAGGGGGGGASGMSGVGGASGMSGVGVSGAVLSSLVGIGGLGGGGSGPGTASNGGSVPLTPTTDDPASFDHYHHVTLAPAAPAPSSSLGFPRGGGGYADGGGADDDDENDEEDEDEKMTMPLPPLGVNGGSPRRGGGVTRTAKKRRSATIAAGPSVAAGSTRSRSGTMVNGGGGASSSAAAVAANAAVAAGMMPSNGLGGGSLTMSPVDMHGAISASMGLGMLVPSSSSSSSPVNGSSGSGGNIATAVGVVGGQANSPLAMKELSPDIKPTIETYLNRYLNYLCVNPNAKDRMGHQIHQMYTARRIQRYEQLYGWRPLKFRIEAFVNGFVDLTGMRACASPHQPYIRTASELLNRPHESIADPAYSSTTLPFTPFAHVLQLTARGLSQDVTMKIPHYLNNSRLFSRFNESGNRMKSQGQTIWRVRARCRNDIPGVDAPAHAGFHHHPSAAAFSQQHIQLHQQIQQQQQQQQVHHQHDGTMNGLMIAPDPLLWEFLPYERSIVGQPPLAIVGTAWQWNMKVHDHWTPRKKVNWSFASNATSSDTGAGSVHDGSDSPSPPSASPSSPSSTTLPKWLSLQGSKLKGTPTESGVYPISIEATFQEDNDPEPVVVRGNYAIQVSKAIGGWKTKVALPQDGVLDSPEVDHAGGSGDIGYGHESGSGRGLSGGHAGSGHGTDDAFPSLITERMDQLTGVMYDANQGSTSGFQGISYTYTFAH